MIELSADAEALRALGRVLKSEADGKALRRDLIRELKEPLRPAISEIRAGLMSVGHGGLPTEGEPLRAAVAKRIVPEVKLSGRFPGVRIKARKTPGVRGFAHAARRLNRAGGWRHRVYGRNVWVHQVGKPEYFDRPLQGRGPEFRRAVLAAMERTAQRIASKTR